MWDLIPHPIKNYRRAHPYSHPVLFFCLDFAISSMQIVFVCALIYTGYRAIQPPSLNSAKVVSANNTESAATLQSTPLIDVEATGPLKTTVIPASATVVPSSRSNLSTQQSGYAGGDSKRLLDGKFAARWIMSLPDSQYIIQYAASTDKVLLKKFANTHLQNGAAIFPFKITSDNQTMYGVASGLYDSLNGALSAIDHLPDALKRHSPWVRPVINLKKQVAKTTVMLN